MMTKKDAAEAVRAAKAGADTGRSASSCGSPG
jgi:hypothetical protein